MGFEALEKHLEQLASLPARVTKEVAEELEELIQEEFEQGHDPYGRPWQNLSTGKPSRLQETSNMRGSVEVTPQRGAGLEITINDTPFVYHQFGTKNMVARPILPDEPELPKSWQNVIADAYGRAYKK